MTSVLRLLELQCREVGTSTCWMVVQCMCTQNNDTARVSNMRGICLFICRKGSVKEIRTSALAIGGGAQSELLSCKRFYLQAQQHLVRSIPRRPNRRYHYRRPQRDKSNVTGNRSMGTNCVLKITRHLYCKEEDSAGIDPATRAHHALPMYVLTTKLCTSCEEVAGF